MKGNLTIDEKVITIPSSHKEIKLIQFENLVNIFKKDYQLELLKNIDLVATITNLSVDEVEQLDLDTFNEIIDRINSIDIMDFGKNYMPEINVNGELFGTKAADDDYKFTVKETLSLQALLVDEREGYISEICAIIYHPIVDGVIKKDYSEKAINERKEKFKDLTIDIVGPYLTKLNQFLDKKKNA